METTVLEKPDDIQVIELYMMDKRKFFPLTACSSFAIRGLMYPFSLIKTRLQVQKQHAVYQGTFDAFLKISKNEGFRGLYRGFWVTNLLIISSVSYISTYESVRHYLQHHTSITHRKARALCAGACASFVGQTTMVPIDIVSQHLQVMAITQGKNAPMSGVDPLKIPAGAHQRRFGVLFAIIRGVYNKEGIRGFYKGYLASLSVYAPNSALWWFFYDTYCTLVASISPDWVPRLVVHVLSAPLGGITTTVLFTPLDAIRARIQIEGTRFIPTARMLWQEEKLKIFAKGLSARLIQSVTFSFFIILGYETVKRLSLLEEYKHTVRW